MRFSCPLADRAHNNPDRFGKLELPVNAGTTAREGKRTTVSTSSGVFTVLSRYSRSKASPTPPTKPTKKARAIFRVLAGREGAEGTTAGSTIRILEDFRPEEICASFSLVSKQSYSNLLASASRLRMLY